MDHEHKNQSPYRGMWAICTVMIVAPIVVYIVFHFLFVECRANSPELNLASARFLASGFGVLFHLSCAVAGAFKEPFAVVRNRVADFFGNLTVSLRFALKYYWEDMKLEGVAFLIYFIIMATCGGICLEALIRCLALV